MVASHRDRARMLARYGVITASVLNDETRSRWASCFWQAMDEFPEYTVRGKDAQRVLGGFGALGNPASFHHPTVQRWRVGIKRMMQPLFREYVELQGFSRDTRLEKLFDRIVVRCEAFGQPTKETWHRDIYDHEKNKLRSLPSSLRRDGQPAMDEMFGGWVNLSDRDQKFICIVGSHKEEAAMRAQASGGGFATLTDQEIAAQDVKARLKRQANRKIGTCRTDEDGCVIVPPGSVVLFFQRILHSVAGGKQPADPQLKIMNGLRLTRETSTLFDHESVVLNNAVPRIPSGQIPPMYSANHYSFFPKQPELRAWGERTFKHQCLFERVTPTGQTYFTPGSADNRDPSANRGRYMPSLAEMGLPTYPYTQETARALQPEPLFEQG